MMTQDRKLSVPAVAGGVTLLVAIWSPIVYLGWLIFVSGLAQ